MAKTKIAITLDQNTVLQLDRLIEKQTFRNRSQAIQQAVAEKLERLDRSRLARECAKLDPVSEQSLAEEKFTEDVAQWPRY